MYSIMNYHNMIRVIRAYCDNSNLQLKLTEGNYLSAATDGKTVFLPMPGPDWTDKQLRIWFFLAFHEAGHNTKQNRGLFTLLDKEKLYGSDMMWYLNIIDDHSQERKETGYYAGRDAAVNEGRAAVSMDILGKIAEHGTPEQSTKELISGSLFCWSDRTRPAFQPAMRGLGDILYDTLTDQQKAWCDQLVAYNDRLMGIVTAQDELDLMRELLEKVFKLPEEEREKIEDGMSRSEAEKANRECKGGRDRLEEDQHGCTGSPQESNTAAGEGTDEASLGTGKLRWEDLIPDNHEEFVASHSDSVIDYSGFRYESSAFVLDPNPTIVTTMGPRSKYTVQPVANISNRVRKLLRVKSQKRWVHQQEKGKLSSRSLHNIADPGSTENYRLYKQKTSAITLNAAVTLLIDMSGSMGGEKYQHAIDAAFNMYAALSKLRIPSEIIGFRSNSGDTFTLFKTFAERLNESTLKERLEHSSPGNCNEDAAALTFAAGRLITRKEPGKHLIVFSDGSPAGYNDDSMGAAVSVAKKIQKSGISLMGIGIQDSSVKYIYKDYAVIKNVRELESALMEIIKTKLLG